MIKAIWLAAEQPCAQAPEGGAESMSTASYEKRRWRSVSGPAAKRCWPFSRLEHRPAICALPGGARVAALSAGCARGPFYANRFRFAPSIGKSHTGHRCVRAPTRRKAPPVRSRRRSQSVLLHKVRPHWVISVRDLQEWDGARPVTQHTDEPRAFQLQRDRSA